MNIIIADNQILTRIGMHFLIKEEFQDAEIKEIEAPHELMRITPENNLGVLIIDPESIKLNEIVELSVFRKRNPETSIMVVTNNKQYGFVRKILDIGIINIIFKTCDRDTFLKAFRSALNKKKYFDGQIMENIIDRKNMDTYKSVELTPAEKEIVRMIAQGLTTKDIALKKFLSVHTITTHRKNIFRKLKINNSSELLMYSVKAGIIDTTEYYI